MKKIALASALVAVAVAAPASAEVFSGPFVGAQISRDAYEVKAKNTDILIGDLSADGVSANGVGGGIYAGYDYPVSNSVFIGVEANANLSSASASAKLTDGVDAIGGKVRARESFGLSARLGAMISDSTALYARGGWQTTKFKLSAFDGADNFRAKDTQDALVYGAGLETRVNSNVSVRVEYLIEDFGSAGLNNNLGTNGINVDNNKLSLGVSYRF